VFSRMTFRVIAQEKSSAPNRDAAPADMISKRRSHPRTMDVYRRKNMASNSSKPEWSISAAVCWIPTRQSAAQAICRRFCGPFQKLRRRFLNNGYPSTTNTNRKTSKVAETITSPLDKHAQGAAEVTREIARRQLALGKKAARRHG